MDNSKILEGYFSIDYIKSLSSKELTKVAQQLRDALIYSLLKSGGHLSSNLGAIELTFALHYVFDSPNDKFIFDVGHQCYSHKILTGRHKNFEHIRQLDGISGFPRHQESEHDIVSAGHAGVSLSIAAGMLAGRRSEDILRNRVVAVIGDAGLSAGIAFEALNHIGALGLPIIILLNDNQMSIAPGCGALHRHLTMVEEKNFFTALGFTYWGVYDGHNCVDLVNVLVKAKSITEPLVIHIKTVKGKGYIPAEEDPVAYHGIMGEAHRAPTKNTLSYTQVFSESLVELVRDDKNIAVVTAAMPTGTGTSKVAELFPESYYDVAIAEQHAITFASGLALSGKTPIVALYSTFLQRAIDQIIHDVVMQGLAMIISLDRAGVVAGDGESHQGVYDIALLQSLPNSVFLAPATGEELRMMMFWAVQQKKLVFIRYAKAEIPDNHIKVDSSPLRWGIGQYWYQHSQADVLIVALGSMSIQALESAKILRQSKVLVDVYNARFVQPIDRKVWFELCSSYRLIVTIEEAVVLGGWGTQIQSIFSSTSEKPWFLHIGVENGLLPQGSREELLTICKLDVNSLVERIENEYRTMLGQTDIMNQKDIVSHGF